MFPYWKKASLIAYIAAASWLLYALFFVVFKDVQMSSIFLLIAGFASIEVAVSLYLKTRDVDEGWALIALILGAIGAAGVAIHGAYDLANTINPPLVMNTDLPSQIDPRGFLAFFISGAALLKFSYLMWVGKKEPKNLALLGFVSGIVLVLIYLGRLIILDPTSPMILYPVLLQGFILGPLWYLWLGVEFGKKK